MKNYIKSVFFGNLPKIELLEIVKYNKNLEQILNLNINNYK